MFKSRFGFPLGYGLMCFYLANPFLLPRPITSDRSEREEKSLRHVAMVVKFLDDNKPKSILFNSFNLSNVGEICWGWFWKDIIEVKKKKNNIFVFCSPTP